MFTKTFIVFILQNILIQYAFCQILLSAPYDNFVVENTMVADNGLGLAGSNLATFNTLGISGNLPGALASGLLGNTAGVNIASASGLGSVGNLAASSLVNNLAAGFAAGSLSPSSLFTPSGSLTVTSYSPLVPNGLTVASENMIEGLVTVNGQLPFLSAVAFEAELPSSGQGVTSCGCGNGEIGITQEGLPSPAGLGRAGYGNGLGYNAGIGRMY